MGRCCTSAENGAHAGEQFARVEWLWHVVVGADFKTHNAIDIVARGEKQYTHG